MKSKFSKITVIGLGYIGLPTATMFATKQIEVVGVDVNKAVIDTVNQGEIHIVEPDLDLAVKNVVANGYLRAVETPEPSDVFIITVPTPFKGTNHQPNTDFIYAASKAIASVLSTGNLIILESTSPVGTTEKLCNWLEQERPDLSFPQRNGQNPDINVAYCPERVMPGNIMRELVENDRIIGGMTKKCSQKARDLYKSFMTAECYVASSPRVAELAKLSENSYRDVNIAFANELAQISEKFDIDPWELIGLANKHPRVNILQPGPGVGGHCIAVDPWFIISGAPEESQIIHAARTKNTFKPSIVIEKVTALADEHPQKKIICMGLSYKPDIDDLRESPSKEIFDALRRKYGNRVEGVEPNIPQSIPLRINVTNIEDVMSSDHIIVLLVAHKEFFNLRPLSQHVVKTIGIWR